MNEALLGLPSHVRRGLADALESGKLSVPCSATAARSVLGVREDADSIVEAVAELDRMGISDHGAAALIRTVEQSSVSHANARSRLVRTGGARPPRPRH